MQFNALAAIALLMASVVPCNPRVYFVVFVASSSYRQSSAGLNLRACLDEAIRGTAAILYAYVAERSDTKSCRSNSPAKQTGQGFRAVCSHGSSFECALLRVEDRAGFVPRPGIGSFRRNRAHKGPVWRIEVKSDHIPELLFKMRIVGNLEGSSQMRFETIRTPQCMNRRGQYNTLGFCHAAQRPALPSFGRLGHLCNDLGFNLLAQHRFASGPRRFMEPIYAAFPKAALPQADDWAIDAHPLSGLFLTQPLGSV